MLRRTKTRHILTIRPAELPGPMNRRWVPGEEMMIFVLRWDQLWAASFKNGAPRKERCARPF
jgi:hypothetical protein